MFKRKEQAMREEARKAIVEALKNGYAGYYRDLHSEVFNTNCYIIGAEQARKALKEYDVFEALACLRWLLLYRSGGAPKRSNSIERGKSIMTNNLFLKEFEFST